MRNTEYAEYLRKLDYPEYSHPSESLDSSKRSKLPIDMELLDMSLGQKAKIDRKLIRIVKDSLASVGKYSPAQDNMLKKLISNKTGVPVTKILMTAGCDGGLRVVSRLLISKGSKVCIPLPSFGRYEYHGKVNRAKIIFVPPLKFPFALDLDRIARVCKDNKVDVLFLANPNNPTGMYKTPEEIGALLEGFEGCLILDEALINPDNHSCAGLLGNHNNLIITRSFSKLYGLAGARIGYVLANDDMVSPLQKLISPFEVSSVALSLAIAVLRDDRFERDAKEQLSEALKVLEDFSCPDIVISSSESSTVLVKWNSEDRDLYQELFNRGVKTVSCSNFRGLEMENCVRISVKEASSVRKLLDILTLL